MTELIFIPNIYDRDSIEIITCDDPLRELKTRLPVWPSSGKVYKDSICEVNEINPMDIRNHEKVYVVVFPEGLELTAAALSTFLINTAISIAASFVLNKVFGRGGSPSRAQQLRNTQTTSSNNQLTDRTNKVRLGTRIPDIFGQVRSIPDMIALPYKIYKNHQQVELAYMCIGRGEFDVSDVREGSTLVSQIAGTTVEIWAPDTSPNTPAGTPQLRIGSAITEDVVKATQVRSVSYQTLRAPNADSVTGLENIRFVYPDTIEIDSSSSTDFTDFFAPSDILEITEGSVDGLDFNGSYTILSVSAKEIALSSPAGVAPDWGSGSGELGDTAAFPTGETSWASPILSTSGDKWVGPFLVDRADTEQIYTNFIAERGLYKDNGTSQSRFDVEVQLEVTPTDQAGTPTGSPETFNITIEGSATSIDARAATMKVTPTLPNGYCSVRAKRITEADLSFKGAVVDEVKWETLYAVAPVTQEDFGNVTTVFSLVRATASAISVQERQLNMLVTRKLPQRISGSTFGSLAATRSADDILSFICLDQYLGNRQTSEVDFDSFYDTVATIKEYFGDDQAGYFDYTFDDAKMSFEEMLTVTAESIFSNCYRQGNQIKLFFEKSTENSSLLFNHRNKTPGSETRSVTFGNPKEYDGVELKYISPEDNLEETYQIPEDGTAVTPLTVETIGVRSDQKAFWHAWRTWNKIRNQSVVTEFTALSEASLTILNERVLVADNTRSATVDGEIRAMDGLIVELSQPWEPVSGHEYTIHLQLYDGSVQNIPVTGGDDEYHAVLGGAPYLGLVVDDSAYVKTGYIITDNANEGMEAFRVVEKSPENNYLWNLTCEKYSPLHYQNDGLSGWWFRGENNALDYSPYLRTATLQGGAAIANDGTRGYSFDGSASTDYATLTAFNAPASYSKMCWVTKDSGGTEGHILSSVTTGREAFGVDSSGSVFSWHGSSATGVSAALGSYAAWHHVAITYDADTTTMKLYIDGELVDTDTSISQRTLGNLTAFGYNSGNGFIGRGQDLRLYARVLNGEEIKEIFKWQS